MATSSEERERAGKEAPRPGLWGRRWFRRLSIGAGVALALFTIVGFLVLPPVLRRVAETQLRQQLGRRASIGAIHVNPFALSLGIDDLQIYERDGATPFVGWKRFYVNVQWASLLRRAPVVQELRLEGLQAHLVHTRQTEGGFGDLAAYNFSDILAKLQADAARQPAPPPAPPRAEPPRFSLNNIRLLEGTVTFDDRPTGGHHELAHLSVGVPFVSTLPVDLDTFVKPGLALALDGTPFAIEGQTKPFKGSLETTLELRLTALDLARYQAYVPLPLKFRLDSGKLTVALDLSFVRLGEVPSVNLKGRVALDQLAVRRLGPAGAPVLNLATLDVQLGRADLSALDFHVDKVALSGLELYAQRLRDGEIDLLRLLPQPPPAAPAGPAREAEKGKARPRAAPGAGPRYVVDQIALDKINLHLRDETVRPAFVETIRELSVHVAHLSNAPGARATVTAHLTAVPGGVLAHTGTLSLQPFAAAGTVTLDGVEPARFAPYYQDQLTFDVAEGRVRLGTGYHLATVGARTTIALDDAFVELANVKLRRRAAPGKPAPEEFFRLEELAVRKVGLDLDAHTVKVGEIASHDLRVRAARNEAGVLDLTALVAPSPPASTGVAPARPAVAPAPAPAAPAGSVDVADVTLQGWAARFDDRAVKPRATVTLEGLGVHATDLSTRPGTRATVDVKATLNQTGKLHLGGSAVAASGGGPPAVDLRFDLRDIAILPFQPYFRDKVNLVVTDGAISLKGHVKVEAPPAAKAQAGPRIAFTGDLDVAHFDALDGHKNEKLLSWKSFHVGGIDFASVPPAVSVREIALTDYTAKLMIFPDAHFNVQDIAATTAAPSAPPPSAPPPAPPARPTAGPSPAPAPMRVTVGQVTLQGGDVSFTDRLIRPNYSTQLTELGGRVTGLSSEAQSTAEVSLRGAIDHSGTLTIDGKMNPLSKELFVDLKIRLSDFELPPTSPYAARYAGYGIEKGKLSLSLDYRIAGRKLDAKNKLTLDQFTFGDEVDSPTAVKLPLKLAIALLKDRHGVIDIDLPISGSLDDPQFRLGPLILKTLGNLIVKAVTAPFSLIARAFGGGDEESYLEFASGLSRVTPKGLTKLQGIARALRERPGLSFENEGLADPQTDRSGLRQELYERKLRAQKRRALAEAGQAAPAGDALVIDAAERPQLIEAVYRAETFPKPRAPNGGEKVLPPPEMEKLILANIRVDADELRELALRRAGAVRDALARAAPAASPRLFLLDPRTSTPGNRVQLTLKKD